MKSLTRLRLVLFALLSIFFTACGGGGGTPDTTPPDTDITSTPATITNSSDANFVFTATEASSTFEVSLDGGVYVAATSPHTFTSLGDGAHTVDIRATDAAGNTDTSPASYSWTVDTVAPNTAITSSPPATSNITKAIFEFSASEVGSTLEISLDGGTYAAATSPHTYMGMSDGVHTVDIRATDAAGNTDASPASYSWTVALPSIVVSACSSVTGDSVEVSGEAIFTKSHLRGSPVYRIVTPRQLGDTTPVSVDYMVHHPLWTPKGVVVLIAGGKLNAGITGTGDDTTPPTNSFGNFLVRSAAKYQDQGYRAISIDRPSDYASYGTTFSYQMDAYRHSMKHAVDIATILQRENTEGYNVIISGTSRGSISAAAVNTLAAGIAMSSALTGGTDGTPVGSTSLPLSRIERASHILLHTDDTCAITLPADSHNLFDDLVLAGNTVSGNEVNGGFRQTAPIIDVCGAFDYHGYTGIETCAVQKETAWMDSLITGLGLNTPPVADSQSVNEGDTITLTASDADGNPLSYAVPYATSSLGGSVSTDVDGNVTYTAPAGASGAIDTFAFTVTDGNGGVSTAVISITLI